MRIYVHREEQVEPEAMEVSEETIVSVAFGADGDDLAVLLEDEEVTLDVNGSVAEVEITERAHVFVGRPKQLTVEVEFNAVTKAKEFSPSARVAKVFDWAVSKEGFDLARTDAAEHTLALRGSGEIPPPDAHIGSLRREEHDRDRICFQLIPKHRYEG